MYQVERRDLPEGLRLDELREGGPSRDPCDNAALRHQKCGAERLRFMLCLTPRWTAVAMED